MARAATRSMTAPGANMAKQSTRLDNPFEEIGASGLKQQGGRVQEEFLRELQGPRGIKTFREMKDNDDIIGAILYAIKSLIRSVTWTVEPFMDETVSATTGVKPEPKNEDTERAAFLGEALFKDMDIPWTEQINEILSMLWAGFCPKEITFKKRGGPSDDPVLDSRFSDQKITWLRWGIRAQESLLKWEFGPNGELLGMWQTPAPDFRARFIPINKLLLFRTDMERGNPEGRSMLRNAYRSWWFKNHIQTIEGIGIERDLAGYPVFTVDKDGPDLWNKNDSDAVTEKANIIKLYKSIRRDEQEGMLKPWWLTFELVSTGGRRQFDTSKIITRYDQRMAMTVIADFILLGHDAVGSKAMHVDKTKIFSTSLTGILDVITSLINRRAIPQLFGFNGMPLDRMPVLAHGNVEEVDLVAIGEFLNKLSGAGAEIFPSSMGTLENHLLKLAGLPQDVVQDVDVGKRRTAALDDMRDVLDEIAANCTVDYDRLETYISKALAERTGHVAPGFDHRAFVTELRPLIDSGESHKVVGVLDVLVQKIETMAVREPAPPSPVHLTVASGGRKVFKIERDERGLSRTITVEPEVDDNETE